jgi:hypothetical protein
LPLSNTFRGDTALAGPHPRNMIQSMGTGVSFRFNTEYFLL